MTPMQQRQAVIDHFSATYQGFLDGTLVPSYQDIAAWKQLGLDTRAAEQALTAANRRGTGPDEQGLKYGEGYRRGGRIRMADGGSLLSNALNALTTPDPSGSNPITQTRTVNPYTGDYNTYGEGPEWNWFDYLNSGANGGAPPPTTPPPGTPPPTGGGTDTPGQPTGGFDFSGKDHEGNGFGGKGALGNGPAQAAADAAARNTAVNPSLKGSLGLMMATTGPLGMFGALAKQALASAGLIKSGPFDVPGPTLSPEALASIANVTSTMNQNLPAVAYATAINNEIARQRALANAGQGDALHEAMGHVSGTAAGYSGSGGREGNYGGVTGANIAGADPRGDRADAGGGDSGGHAFAGSGGPEGAGGMGGLSGGRARGGRINLSSGGTPRMKSLGWLANGGRLNLAGGGSAGSQMITSLLPIAAGLIGNIVSGPIGGAIASGAATAMTGGTLQDAVTNSGPDVIDSFFKYFGPLLGYKGENEPQGANTNTGMADPGVTAFLKALTRPAPAPAGSSGDTSAAPAFGATLPYSRMAGGGTPKKPSSSFVMIKPGIYYDQTNDRMWISPQGHQSDLPAPYNVWVGDYAYRAMPSPGGGWVPGRTADVNASMDADSRGSMVSEYSAGGELDARGGTHVQGEGDGQSDDIPAKLSDGEFVWSAQDVSDLGNGSNKAGADRLEEMRRMVRARAGRKNIHTIAPKQKSVAHLLSAVTKAKAA